MRTRRSQVSPLKRKRAWFLWSLPLVALLLSSWQTSLSRIVYREAGTREFLKVAFESVRPSSGSHWPVTMDANAPELAISYLTLANTDADTQHIALNSYRTLGVAALAARNPVGAKYWLTRRLELAPTDVLARFYLGEAYLQLGDVQAAIEQWEAAGSQKRLLDLAEELIGREMALQALAALDAVLRLDATDVDARWFAAEIWREQDNSERALELYQEMIALAPQSLGPRQRMAEIWAEQDDVERALEMCQELIAIAPHMPDGYVLSGVILFDAERYEPAITFFEQALQRDPASPRWIWVNLGKAHAAVGRWAEAIDAYERAIQEDPTDHWDYVLVGDAHCQRGHPKEALAYFEQAVDSGNQSSRVRQVADYIAQNGHCPPGPEFH